MRSMNESTDTGGGAPRPLLILLLGPTASGKTDLAMALRERLSVELISVDSALVYRGMDIGTAKPDAGELARAPHQLVDICDPAEPYSVADFRRDALAAIAEIRAAGRTPLLVGGTMLYFKALLEGLAEMPAADPGQREAIEAEAARHGWPHLHAQLAQVDPELAAGIHPNHSQRIGRALEVYRSSGVSMSEWRRRQNREAQDLHRCFKVVQIGLLPRNRALLHDRIERRFDQMLADGFIDEVRQLYQRPDLHPDLPAMRAVGYRQAWQYLAGECDRAQLAAAGKAATRQLAKRQLTWLRGWPGLRIVYMDDSEGRVRKKSDLVHEILNYLPQTSL